MLYPLWYDGAQKTLFAAKNLPGLSASLFLAQEMGEKLG